MVYFLVDTYIDAQKREAYDAYIEAVKPIVESYGGEYLARSEKVVSLHEKRDPQRVIIIRFPSKERLNACFSSPEYIAIQSLREVSVDARALIVEEEE
ncbi:MAG: DUF1330 domain-containing protein [Bacillota bacterium]|nr:DUF1330 domain-containing protein [Bacillota bacterium]